MHARGAMPEPDSREPWFICEAHAGDDSVDRSVTAFEESLRSALDERARGGIAGDRALGFGSASEASGH
jgi:hypothetical protein